MDFAILDMRWKRDPNPPFDQVLQYREGFVDSEGYTTYEKWADVPVVTSK